MHTQANQTTDPLTRIWDLSNGAYPRLRAEHIQKETVRRALAFMERLRHRRLLRLWWRMASTIR